MIWVFILSRPAASLNSQTLRVNPPSSSYDLYRYIFPILQCAKPISACGLTHLPCLMDRFATQIIAVFGLRPHIHLIYCVL